MFHRLKIIWKRQGDVKWEDWWVEKYDRKRARVPDINDHISFANFDLKNYHARIFEEGSNLFVELLLGTETSVKMVLSYHGFEIIDQ